MTSIYNRAKRTNKNAGIRVITGLAFVALAGLCITYQDLLRQKLGRAALVLKIFIGDRCETIGVPERILTSGLCLRGCCSVSQLDICKAFRSEL